MKLRAFLVVIYLFGSIIVSVDAQTTITNQAGTISMTVDIDRDKRPFYFVLYNGQKILEKSYIGLSTNLEDFRTVKEISRRSGPDYYSDKYTLHHGKQKDITYTANEYRFELKSDSGQKLEWHVHLSDHGLAFRYYLPGDNSENVVVTGEATTYALPENSKAWMQPMSKAKSGWCQTNPSYEEQYYVGVDVDKKSDLGEGFVYPALFKTGSTWILVSETGLHRNYCGTRLKWSDNDAALRVTFPQPEEVLPGGGLLPEGGLPFYSPWRILTIGSLEDIVESTLGTDLAEPAITMDDTFVNGGLASWSWILLKDNFTNYETSRQFIDYASMMNWQYCLIDADWDQKIGYDRMRELINYAESKGVFILLWYNSSGSWNSTEYTPKSKLIDSVSRRNEFERLRKMGVRGIKVDFFGGDGQSVIAYYHDIMKDAADYRLMLNFHGATLPRGWQRTYPHLMTVEAIKGGEFITFEQSNADLAPEHCTIIPFTRNVYDPMDFTPMVLDEIPNIKRKTTTAFELALPILFTSGIQHMAEIPDGMEKMPEYVRDFLRDIPVQWDETRFISGFPGEDVVLARRKGDTWYIVGINGEAKTKHFNLDFSFTGRQKGDLFINDKMQFIARKPISGNNLDISLDAYDGFVIRMK